jgi:hypothetical protein
VWLCLTPDLVVNTVVTFVILLAVRSMDVSRLPLPFSPAGPNTIYDADAVFGIVGQCITLSNSVLIQNIYCPFVGVGRRKLSQMD